jgi:nicotinate-nucleotide adenylyltransferase
MRIGLFFGSFNPIHIGHLIIANYMVTQTDLDKVWLIVSPHNPLKPKSSLARDYDRLHLVRLAIGDNPKLHVSNIEFDLPKPSYTIDTLTHLKEKHPKDTFVLIMGGDSLDTLPKWKNYELLLRDYDIYVYQRPGYALGDLAQQPNVKLFDAPQMHISASYVRDCIQNGHSVQYLVTNEVFEYLSSSKLYR